jgi:hypothetical protein
MYRILGLIILLIVIVYLYKQSQENYEQTKLKCDHTIWYLNELMCVGDYKESPSGLYRIEVKPQDILYYDDSMKKLGPNFYPSKLYSNLLPTNSKLDIQLILTKNEYGMEDNLIAYKIADSNSTSVIPLRNNFKIDNTKEINFSYLKFTDDGIIGYDTNNNIILHKM